MWRGRQVQSLGAVTEQALSSRALTLDLRQVDSAPTVEGRLNESLCRTALNHYSLRRCRFIPVGGGLMLLLLLLRGGRRGPAVSRSMLLLLRGGRWGPAVRRSSSQPLVWRERRAIPPLGENFHYSEQSCRGRCSASSVTITFHALYSNTYIVFKKMF